VQDKAFSLLDDRWRFGKLLQLGWIYSVHASKGYRNYHRLQSICQGIGAQGTKEGLLETLVRFRDFQSSDPRDKVYALLELVKQNERIIVPDYLISTVECYTKTAYLILCSRRDLNIFNITFRDISSRNPALPSWVPH
jgi:hypothetical protein